MNLTRRAALLSGASILATATVGVASLPAVASEDKEYGWSRDGHWFEGSGFASRADAVEDAYGYFEPGDNFQTAEVFRATIVYPDDCAEKAVDWLINGGLIGNAMASWLECANEEGDYEGELSDACFHVERETMGNAGRVAVIAALERHGDKVLAATVRDFPVLPDDIEISEPLCATLVEDKTLESELQSAIVKWAEAHSLETELHGLTVADAQHHVMPATS